MFLWVGLAYPGMVNLQLGPKIILEFNRAILLVIVKVCTDSEDLAILRDVIVKCFRGFIGLGLSRRMM